MNEPPAREARGVPGLAAGPAAERLAASAPVARHVARSACVRGCEPYHGLIQYLRMLGAVAAPDRHADFYAEQLGGASAVLVAGAADYGMVARVLAAGSPAITVIDLCPTPLLLSAWYAAERGADIDTEVADVRTYEPREPVDVVVTDSMLTLLGDAGRRQALRAWRDALRPGGRVVTTMRIPERSRPGGEAATDAFVAWVLAEAERRGGLPGLGPEELEAAVRRFAGAPFRLEPVRTYEELTALVEDAGLRVERLDRLHLPGNAPEGAAAPGIHRAERYARLVAVRP